MIDEIFAYVWMLFLSAHPTHTNLQHLEHIDEQRQIRRRRQKAHRQNVCARRVKVERRLVPPGRLANDRRNHERVPDADESDARPKGAGKLMPVENKRIKTLIKTISIN